MHPTVSEIKVEEGIGDSSGWWFVRSTFCGWHRMPGFKRKESAEDVATVIENAYRSGWRDRERELIKQLNLDNQP